MNFFAQSVVFGRSSLCAVLALLLVPPSGAMAQNADRNILQVSIPLTTQVTPERLHASLPELQVVNETASVMEAAISFRSYYELRRLGISFSVISSPPVRPALPAATPSSTGNPDPLITLMVANVDADSIRSTINTLQSFVTRYEYMSQQEAAGDFLLQEFQRWGLQTEVDSFAFVSSTVSRATAIGQDSMLLCTNGKFLFSSDGGQTWQPRYGPLRNEMPFDMSFANRNNGWAVGDYRLLLHTSNGGIDWDLQNIGLSQDLRAVAAIDSATALAAGGYWYSAESKIVRTTDGGQSWSPAPLNPSTNPIAAISIPDRNHCWAVGKGGTVLFSSDAGAHWSFRTLPGSPASIFYDLNFIDTTHGWIVGNDSSLYRTTNGGASWTAIQLPLDLISPYLRGITFTDTSRGVVFDYYGSVLKTTDGGLSWKTVIPSLSGDWSYTFRSIRLLSPNMLVASGPRGIFVSTDTGEHWIDRTATLPNDIVHHSRNILATIPGSVTPESVYVVVAHYDSYGWSYAPGANDNGSGVSAVLEAARICRNFQFGSTITFLCASAEEFGMIGSSHYVLRALQQGTSFAGVLNGDMIGYPTTADQSRLVVGSLNAPNRLIDSAVVYNQRYSIGLTLETFVDYTGASDYGPFALGGFNAIDVGEDTPEAIWSGKDPYYHSDDDLLEHVHVDLVQKGARLMVATAAELAHPLGIVNSVDRERQLPQAFSLAQNFPNPFNPSTTITYQVPTASRVSLRVFDMLGRQIAVLQDGVVGPGTYSATWNTSGASSGLYFCRLETISILDSRLHFSSVRKMALVR